MITVGGHLRASDRRVHSTQSRVGCGRAGRRGQRATSRDLEYETRIELDLSRSDQCGCEGAQGEQATQDLGGLKFQRCITGCPPDSVTV